jgi:probable F420-dependent oxidoreductase
MMKLGINLLNFGPSATPRNFERWARFAEDNGFDALLISDHVAVTPDVQARYPSPFYDPFIILGSIAGMTTRIEIGTTVTVLPYRHPLQVARITANLDVITGGRFIFGVGVGWARQEFQALGIPFERRGAIANESLAAIKLCWTEDVATYEGRFFSFKDAHTGPRPVRRPHPPVWVGGSSDRALQRAVRYGDAWHPIRIRVDWLRDTGLPRLREIAAMEGRKLPALSPRIMLDLREHALPEGERVAGQGSLEQVRGDLRALSELGADYVVLDTYAGKPVDTESLDHHWAMLARLKPTR